MWHVELDNAFIFISHVITSFVQKEYNECESMIQRDRNFLASQLKRSIIYTY